MRYRVIKDTKSDPKQCAYMVFPFGDAEADAFAEVLVKLHEGSVREFDNYAELAGFLIPCRKGGDVVYAYNGPKKLITFDIGEEGFGEEALKKCFAEPAAVAQPVPEPSAQPAGRPAPAGQPAAKTPESLRCVRLARGLVEDMARCKYGVSISTIAETALAYLDAAENAITAEARKE